MLNKILSIIFALIGINFLTPNCLYPLFKQQAPAAVMYIPPLSNNVINQQFGNILGPILYECILIFQMIWSAVIIIATNLTNSDILISFIGFLVVIVGYFIGCAKLYTSGKTVQKSYGLSASE